MCAWSYTGDPSNVNLDAVRLLIGDTDTNDQKLQDAEINYFLTNTNSNVYLAASAACQAISAKFASLVDSSIESIREAASQKYKHYLALTTKLKNMATDVVDDGTGLAFVSGISKDAMETQRKDTDRVQNKFDMDRFSNPPLEDYRDNFYDSL